MAGYTFGDDEPALQRLALVAKAYEPVSQAFLEQHVRPDCPVIVDAGCGPGFSTELIARTRQPRTLIGLDTSASFVRAARRRLPDARFVRHDVTRTPFPGPPADVIYGRLVLAHLADPVAIVERWRQALAPGGVVLSEELEGIEAPSGPLRDYDDLSAGMVERGGGVMFAGPLLAHLAGRCDRVVASAAHAARIYGFNVRLWRERGDTGASPEDLARLEASLTELARRTDGGTVTWIVRQTVVSPETRLP